MIDNFQEIISDLDPCPIEDLIGKTFVRAEHEKEDDENDDAVCFHLADGSFYVMAHRCDNVEKVYLADLSGDLNDLVGTPIIEASKRMEETIDGNFRSKWTFYRISTIKGTVVLRWLGNCENAYYLYSLEVDLWFFDAGRRVQ